MKEASSSSIGRAAVFISCLLAAASVPAQPACPAWTDPHTDTLLASPGADLAALVRSAGPGSTLLLRSGVYRIAATLQFAKDDVTLRSATGNRDDVVLDGNVGPAGPGGGLDPAGFTPEIIAVSASGITLSDITIMHARHHGIHAYGTPDRDVVGLRMRNLRVIDCGEQLIKVNSSGTRPPRFVDSSALECSHIGFVDNSVMEPMAGGFYTGGIDVHGGRGWIIRGNLFRNIQRDGMLMEHAVHMWSKSRGALIENNRFEDVYRAIGLGMKTSETNAGLERHYPDGRGDSPYFDFVEGVVRNNVIFNRAGFRLESGMEFANVVAVEVYHNTVYSVDKPFNSIEYRWPNTSVVLTNNLAGHAIMRRDGASAESAGNLENAPASLFRDAPAGDLRPREGAQAVIDAGVPLPAGITIGDFDGSSRDGRPDIGAYEYGAGNSLRPAVREKPVGRARPALKASTVVFPDGAPGIGSLRRADGRTEP